MKIQKATKNEVKALAPKVDTSAIIREMEEKMPTFIKNVNNKEDMANAIFATSQEMLLVIEDSLIRYHGFSSDDLKNLHTEIKDVLTGVKEFEKHGLSILSVHDTAVIGDKVEKIGIAGLLDEIGGIRFMKERMVRAGIEYPLTMGSAPFLKSLKKKNDKV